MLSDTIVDRALVLVAEGGGNYEYFFSQLKTPDWIAPLNERGRFSHPPDAISEGGYIRFPGWPEGEYLLRMAAQAPNDVFGVLTAECFASSNNVVHEILVGIAAKLPAKLSADVALQEAQWVSRQGVLYGLYPEKAAGLISHLAGNNEAEAAVALLGEILDVHRPPERDEPEIQIEGRRVRWGVDPIGKAAFWDIQQVVNIVAEPLAETAPELFLSVISKTLDKAITIHDNGRGNVEDFSTIWRPHIAYGDNLDRLGVSTENLQVATRLVAERRNDGFDIARRVFRRYEWPIFRRFEAYAFLVSASVPTEIAEEVLIDPSRYIDATANPEFNELLGKWFGRVGNQTRRLVFELIDAGPDLDRYSQYLEKQEAQGNRAESETWLREEWQLRWLTAIAENLDDSRKEKLARLAAKYGPPSPPSEIRGGAVGHYTDVTDDNLRKLAVGDLVQFLKNWTPPPVTDPYSPSRAGLAEVLGRWLADTPSYFSDILESFQDRGLHPTYLRTILDGFTTALKTEKQFDIFSVVRTIIWVLQNTEAGPREEFRWEEDPGWSWTYMSSARFLTELFLHPERLKVERRDEIWPALQLIADVKSPTSEDEREYRTKMDFGMLALNSTRPVGLEAVMRYCRWLKLAGVEVSAATLPAAFELLGQHLDPAVDDSVAVREMYGMQSKLLAWLDREWFESQLPALFPGKPYKVLDKFAWNSFLRFSGPIATMLPAMRFRYERAINGLDATAATVSDAERSLGNHLTRFVAAGSIGLDDPLLVQFFSKASHALRAQAVGDVGWHLGRQAEEIEPVVRDRLMAFWASRLSACLLEGSAAKEEAGAFGWWLQSKKFPDPWVVEQATEVVDKFRDLHPDFAVIQRFAALSDAYPFEAVHCLGVVFEEDREGWAIHGWGDSVTAILESALHAGAKSRDEAVRVINLLVARGNRGYRRLLDE